MPDNLKDILTNLSADIDQETLLKYLEGKLSAEKRHEVEKQLVEHDFESEALDGLSQVNDPSRVNAMVERLNRDLRIRTEKKRRRQEKWKIPNYPWLYLSIIILFLLIILSYIVIHRMRHGG